MRILVVFFRNLQVSFVGLFNFLMFGLETRLHNMRVQFLVDCVEDLDFLFHIGGRHCEEFTLSSWIFLLNFPFEGD